MMDSLENVMSDVESVFAYSEAQTYQTRAHGYLRENEVSRTCDDTAVQAAVTDMARRAYECGKSDMASGIADAESLSDALLEISAKAKRMAREIEGEMAV